MKRSEVIGQQEIWERLTEMADNNRLPHALLFCGPAGCGKFAMAIAFASYLLGERDEEDTPEAKRAHLMLSKFEHPDLHFTYPTIKLPSMTSDHKPVSLDFAKEWHEMMMKGDAYLRINDWTKRMVGEDDTNKQAIITVAESDSISHNMSLMSSQGGYKISIIWMAERMNIDCANKMLKLLEEPPHQSVFILTSEHPELLLETVRSRTQRIDFKKIDTPSIEKALMERRKLEPEAARRIARIANGNWNLAVEELEAGNENQQHLDLFIMLMRLAYKRNIHDLKKWSDVVSGFGREKQKRMLDYFTHMVRESFVYNFQQPDLVYMTEEEENFTRNFSRFINEANVVDIFSLFDECKHLIDRNVNAKMVFFDMTLKTIMLLLRK